MASSAKLPPLSPRTARRLPQSPRTRKRMSTSPHTRGLLYAKLSSLVEGSFYDGMDIKNCPKINNRQFAEHTNVAHIVPTNAVTDSIRLQEKSNDQDKTTDHHIISFIVVYTMIFFNGCE